MQKHWHKMAGWLNTFIFVVVSTLTFILICFGGGNVPTGCLWEYYRITSEIPLLKPTWHYLDLLLTAGIFIPIIIPSCQRYEHCVSLWWFAMIFVIRVDTKSSYMILLQMYIQKTLVKLLPHLLLRKMDWLSHTYLDSYTQYISVLISCRRWHMAKNRIKLVPNRWECKVWTKLMPAAIIWFWIKTCPPKQKRADLSKQPAASL